MKNMLLLSILILFNFFIVQPMSYLGRTLNSCKKILNPFRKPISKEVLPSEDTNLVKTAIRSNIHLPENPEKIKGFKAIVGDIPKQVFECLDFVNNAEKYKKRGANIPRGMLMVGPPGTGKTSIARAISQEANIPFVYSSAGEFSNKYIGQTQANLRDFFKVAREKAKKNNPKKTIVDLFQNPLFNSKL